jgi:hypothetical protein
MTDEILVHEDEWGGPQIQPGETVWNAPRPLFGRTWEGRFRSGIFYAITTDTDDPRFAEENIKLDAKRVRFVNNAYAEEIILAKLKERGYEKPEDIDYTMAELAYDFGLPYVIE